MTYKTKSNLPLGGEIIIREEDNAIIPLDNSNKDYQEYLAWVAEGNTAEEAE